MLAVEPTTLDGPDGPITVFFGEANQKQRVQCSKLAATSFRGSLSTEDYVEREEYLALRPLAQNNGLRYWCISLVNDPAQVLATCKTIQRDILIRDANGSHQQRCYCVASVITASEFRQYGLASLLLNRVAEWMDNTGDAAASMLYTSIGDFYVKRGWDKIPALKSTLTCPPSAFEIRDWTERPPTRPLSSKEIPDLCQRDVKDISLMFDNYTPGANEVFMTVLPKGNLISWLHDRGDFTSLKINGEIPDSHGTVCESEDSWMYWHHEFKKKSLAIQRVRISSNCSPGEQRSIEVLASLLFDALKEACRWKLPEVFVLSPSKDLLRVLKYLQKKTSVEVETKKQTGSVPSVRWRGSDQTKDFMLVLNEHYGWS